MCEKIIQQVKAQSRLRDAKLQCHYVTVNYLEKHMNIYELTETFLSLCIDPSISQSLQQQHLTQKGECRYYRQDKTRSSTKRTVLCYETYFDFKLDIKCCMRGHGEY